MTRTPPRTAASGPLPAETGAADRRRILILGRVQDIPEVLREIVGASALIAPFAALDAALLVRASPDVVLAPLIGTDHDMADVAGQLADLGYAGPLRCYTRPLPRRADLLAALAAAFPGIDVEIVEVPR